MNHTALRNLLVTATLLAGLGLASVADAARFFRYEDESGRLVLSHTIPNERVKFGYEIVDENARVIQTVAPQLSQEEYARQEREKAAVAACEAAVDRVRSLYRSVGDIEYAETQALASIDTQITNTRANLGHVRAQRESLESQAAQMDMAGKAITTSVLENIDSAKSQERNLEEQIELRNREKVSVREDYAYDRVVFRLNSCKSGLPPRDQGLAQGGE